LKLLYLSHVDVSRPYNGSTTRIHETLSYLSRRHEIHLVHVLIPPGELASDIVPHLPPGLAGAHGVPRGGPFSKLFNPGLYRAADRLARQHKFDLVITEFGEAGVYGLILRALRRLPFVYMSQNVESRLHLERARPTLPRRAFAGFLGLVERLCARCAVLTTAVTPADAAVFRRWAAPGRVKVLPAGFRASRFHPSKALSHGRPNLVFVGSMNYSPNREAVRFIVDHVMDRVLERRPDALFQFIGAHEPGFEAIAPRAEFTGFVEDLDRYLRQARLVLAPVATGGGMRMKTIEALACGKMVIAAGRGADGVDLAHVRRLRLVAPEAFAAAVLEELEHGAADDDVDFAYLRAHYSVESTLDRFEADLLRAAHGWRRRRLVAAAATICRPEEIGTARRSSG
jgi:glycosyltransferase involved in cell wall biosynthesis